MPMRARPAAGAPSTSRATATASSARPVQDPKTGRDVRAEFDPVAGTRTDIVTAADKTRTETTTDLTAAPIAPHTVKDGEGYLKIAKDAGLTPEQLLALNPDVDYSTLKPGQQLVVVGAQTTVVGDSGTAPRWNAAPPATARCAWWPPTRAATATC